MGLGMVIGAIVGGAAFTAGVTWFGTTLFASVLTGAALGYSLFDQRAEYSSPTYDFGPLQNTRSQLLPVPVIYGRNKVAGNVIYQSEPGSTINVLIGLGEGEIQSVTDIRANDVPIEDVDDATHTVYYGTSDQIADPRNENGEPLRHTAYIACTFVANDQVSGSAPTVTAIVEGRKVDVWDEGAGTWVNEYSRNPAYCLLDFLTSKRYGLGIPVEKIDRESFKDVAAYCDEFVDGEPRFQLDIVIDSQQEGPDVLSQILATFGGFLTYSEGVIRLRVERSEAPVQAFTMDNIVEGSFSYGKARRKDVPNRIVVEFIDPQAPEGAWERSKIIAEDEADMDLTGEVRERVIQLWGVTRHTQAGRMARFFLDSAHLCNAFCEFKVGIGALACEVGDIVTVSHDVPGWAAKQFRVLSIEEDEHDEMKVSCREYNSLVYHDRGVPYTPPAASTLPNPFARPPHVEDLMGEEVLKELGDGTYVPQIHLTWTKPSGAGSMFWHHALVYVSLDGGATWTLQGLSTGDEFTVGPCEGLTYRCKVVSVAKQDVQADFDTAPTVDVEIAGDTSAPTTPANVAVSTIIRGLRVSCDMPSEPDWASTECHVSTETGFTPGASTLKASGRQTAFEVTAGLNPGTTYYVKLVHVDATGNRSDPSVEASAVAGRAVSIVVAASDTPDAEKATADYVCDGTSDQDEINEAIEALPDYGGEVVLLKGTFVIDGNILVESGVALRGQGTNTVLRCADGSDAVVIKNSDEVNGNTRITISDLCLDGNGVDPSCGISFKQVIDYVISRVRISEMTGYAIRCESSPGGIISQCTLRSSFYGGIASIGIWLWLSNGLSVTGNAVGGFRSHAISMSSCTDCTVTGNVVSESGGSGVADVGGARNTISSNTIEGVWNYGVYLGSSNCAVVANTIRRSGIHGIYLEGADNNTIANNYVAESCQWIDNSDNIHITTDSDYNNIQGNTCRKGSLDRKPRYGIRINTSDCNGNMITNNDLYQSGQTASLSDAGTGTITGAGNRLA